MPPMTDYDDGPPPGLPVHGQVCYLQIPAPDTARAAGFYEAVCGWAPEPAGTEFTAPGLIGQWIEDRPVAPDSGPIAWVWVDGIDDSIAQAQLHGGEVLSPPALDGGVRWLATVRDPAGNTVGLVQADPR
jgi:uncharacterized protein